MTREITFCTLFGLLSAKRKNITTVTAPVGAHVGESLESMWDAMVELRLIGVGFSI